MARIPFKTRTSSIDRIAQPVAAIDVSVFCRDLAAWPRSWMGLEIDLPQGEQLLDCFRPFIAHLASSGLSKKTIRSHVDNLWVLGGEIIRSLHSDPALRKVSMEPILRNAIDDEGGPLIHNGSEEDQHSLDSTCRKFHRFLSQSQK